MESKKDSILELFFNSSKHWHFEELRRNADIGRPQLARWLKIFEKENLIKRVKIKGKMPYYVHNFKDIRFQNQKKLFAWKKLLDSGLIDHLSSLTKAKAVILFGSLSRSDWYEFSDIDIFIYGDDSEFEQGKFELKTNRDIQVHTAKSKSSLNKLKNLLPYIFSGIFIKGSIQDIGVTIHA